MSNIEQVGGNIPILKKRKLRPRDVWSFGCIHELKTSDFRVSTVWPVTLGDTCKGQVGSKLASILFCICCVPGKAMAPHSSTFAWKITWTEEPGGLQSMGSLRVGHD